MSRTIVAALLSITLSVRVVGQQYSHSLDTAITQQSQTAQHLDENLPASEEAAKTVLENSPRHGEFIDIKCEGSQYPIRTWIVYSERKDKAPVVIVTHEIFGLVDVQAIGIRRKHSRTLTSGMQETLCRCALERYMQAPPKEQCKLRTR
jgi:hypothetical protein